MKELLKKTILMGAGLAFMAKEKVEEIADYLVKRGELTEKEAKDLIDELLTKSRDAKNDMESWVEKLVGDVLHKFDIPTRKEYHELKRRIEALEKENMERSVKDMEG